MLEHEHKVMETVQNVVKEKEKEIQWSMIEDSDWRKKIKSIHFDESCNKAVMYVFVPGVRPVFASLPYWWHIIYFYKLNYLQCDEKSILQIFPVKTLIYVKEYISETHRKLKILNFWENDKALITRNVSMFLSYKNHLQKSGVSCA